MSPALWDHRIVYRKGDRAEWRCKVYEYIWREPSVRMAMTPDVSGCWKWVSDAPNTAERLRDLMARAMCPDEWAEYDAGNGVCTNMAGHACLTSIAHASRAYRALFNAGIGIPEPPAPMAKDEH